MEKGRRLEGSRLQGSCEEEAEARRQALQDAAASGGPLR